MTEKSNEEKAEEKESSFELGDYNPNSREESEEDVYEGDV